MRALIPVLLAVGTLPSGCVPPAKCATVEAAGPTAPTSGPVVIPPASLGAANRERVAVLPIEDDELFRAERRALRETLAVELGKRLRDRDIVPLGEVDGVLRPVSRQGLRCAFDGTPAARRASDKGWLTTELLHVAGFENKPEELWVQISDASTAKATLTGAWNPGLEPVARYQVAFSSLELMPEPGGLLGGLMGRFSPKGQAASGGLTLCESDGFHDCAPETKLFSDRATELAACFAGSDDERRELLFEGREHCELTNLDDTTGPDGRREACLCAALSSSTGLTVKPARRRLQLHFEAKDLAGKPRPEVRVVESSTNLHADAEWHSVERVEGGKPASSSVRRLVVDNLDAVRAPLARCDLSSGGPVVVDLALTESGVVDRARVRSGTKGPRESACVEQAVARGAFACSSDGKPAALRLVIASPE